MISKKMAASMWIRTGLACSESQNGSIIAYFENAKIYESDDHWPKQEYFP